MVVSAEQLPRLGPLRVPEEKPGPTLVRRIALAICLIVIVTTVLWFDRDGLRDNAHPEQTPGLTDVFYFTVVSLTTVGYGDIAPVTDFARLFNAIILTPIRIFLWALFLGTAYEISVLRLKFRQERQMRDLKDRLSNHVIVCGYGSKGQAIVDELLAHGHRPEDVVIIDPVEHACETATKRKLVVFRGDASSEDILHSAAVTKAAYVLVAPDRDDAATLICLTVRNLAPDVHIIASARQEENIKLLYGAGAEMVVAPSVTGGRLMAASVRQRAVPQFIEDLLMFGDGLSVTEERIGHDKAGQSPANAFPANGTLVLGVIRDQKRLPFNQLADLKLQNDDLVVLIIDETVSVDAN